MNTLDELKNTGLKATGPRLKILEVFQNANQRHLSAEDIYRLLLDENSDIGLATVIGFYYSSNRRACCCAAI